MLFGNVPNDGAVMQQNSDAVRSHKLIIFAFSWPQDLVLCNENNTPLLSNNSHALLILLVIVLQTSSELLFMDHNKRLEW